MKQTSNTKSVLLSTMAMSMLLSVMVPLSVGAQTNSNTDRDSKAVNKEVIKTQIESLRAQIQELQLQLQSRISSSTNEESPSSKDKNRSSQAVEKGLKILPEQASDRAKHVMYCLQLSRPLKIGSEGDDVQKIQEYLKEKGFFNYPTTTKYFGQVTRKAIEAFQASENIVSSGTPETTGFGVIGPKTQAALIKASCLKKEKTTEISVEDEVENTE